MYKIDLYYANAENHSFMIMKISIIVPNTKKIKGKPYASDFLTSLQFIRSGVIFM